MLPGLLRSTVVARSCISLRSFCGPSVPGSHLFGAESCSGALENADFSGRCHFQSCFRMQRLFGSTVDTCMTSVYRGCALVVYNSGLAGFAGYDAPRAVFFDSGRCKAGFVPLVVDRPKMLASLFCGPEGHFHSVEVPTGAVLVTSLTCPLCSETGLHSPTRQRPSRSDRRSSCARLYARYGQRWV